MKGNVTLLKTFRSVAMIGSVGIALSASANGGVALQSVGAARVDEVKALRFGMMIHWGIATIYERGDIWYVPKDVWKPGTKDPGLFKATGCDPDQWAAAAKAAATPPPHESGVPRTGNHPAQPRPGGSAGAPWRKSNLSAV